MVGMWKIIGIGEWNDIQSFPLRYGYIIFTCFEFMIDCEISSQVTEAGLKRNERVVTLSCMVFKLV